MRDWTRSMVATAAMVGASMVCLLPESPARAQQGPAEFDFEADVIDWGKAELSLEWNSVGDKITVGEALITLAKPSKLPVYLKTGRGVVPFGISTGTTVAARLEESLTITGPLTIEVFETKEDYAQLGVHAYGFNAGVYTYNGSTDNNVRGKQLEHYGFTVSYAQKTALVSFDVGVDWIDSVFDSNGLTDAFPELVTRPRRAYTPGIAGRARFGLWGFSLVGEYNGATRQANFTRDLNENLVPVRTRPEAWQVELGYTGRIFDVRPYGAFSYSETSGLRAGFPKKRILGAVGTWLSDNMRVVLEYANEVDYSKVAEGTGRDSDAMTLRLTYEW